MATGTGNFELFAYTCHGDGRLCEKLTSLSTKSPAVINKKSWGAYYFLTKKEISVNTEIYLAYNTRRVMSGKRRLIVIFCPFWLKNSKIDKKYLYW